MRKEKTKNTSKSFFRTILLSFVSVSLLTTLTLTVFLTLNFAKSSSDMVTKYHQKLLAQTNYTINQMNVNVQHITNALFNDHNVVSYLYGSNPYGEAAVLANQELRKHLVSMSNMESIYLYNTSMDTFFSSKTGIVTPREEFSDKLAAALVGDPAFSASYSGIPTVGAQNENYDGSSAISYYCFDNSTPGQERKSVIIFNVSPSYITSSIRSMNNLQNNTDTNFVVMTQNGDVVASVLSPDLKVVGDLYDTLFDETSASPRKFLRLGGMLYLCSMTQANDNEWYLFSLSPISSLFGSVFVSALLGAVIMTAVLIACFAVCLRLAKRLNSPIRALTGIMEGEASKTDLESLQNTEEFHRILASYERIHQQNRQLSHLKWENAHSSQQNYLNMLLTGNHMESREQIRQKLAQLELSRLFEASLCMALFKIDNYRSFCETNNRDELWILRFAAVNIMEETAAPYFTCKVVNRDNDKFVILLSLKEGLAYKALTEKLEKMIGEIQDNIERYMKITMTAAYSTPFEPDMQISRIYGNLEDSLHLKMKFGHGAVISPHMLDDAETETYQFPDSLAEELLGQILAANKEEAQALSRELSTKLFLYDYSEILSGMIHLLYSLYLGIIHRFPQLTEDRIPPIG